MLKLSIFYTLNILYMLNGIIALSKIFTFFNFFCCNVRRLVTLVSCVFIKYLICTNVQGSQKCLFCNLHCPAIPATHKRWQLYKHAVCERHPLCSYLRNSASSFHWLSSSIFSCLSVPHSDISSYLHYMMFHSIQTIIFCEDMILATFQCQHIFCC